MEIWSKNKIQLIILLLFVSIVLAFHMVGYTGHYGYDDLHYAKLANDWKNGIVDFNDHFTYRTPILVFTGLSYMIFRVNDFASSLPALLITTGVIFLVFLSLRNKNSHTLILGLALTVFSSWFIFYSDKLMPDMYLTFSVMLSLFIIHQYKFHSNKGKTFFYSFLLSLSLLFGFMSKGTIVLLLPVLIYLIGVDFILKRDRRFWYWFFLTGVILLLVYFFIIALRTGNAFKRFDAIVSNSYINLCSYELQSINILLKRIFYDFFSMLVNQTMAIGFIFLIACFAEKKSLKHFQICDSFSFWTASALILLLSSNFMTISFSSYSPMCIDPRHYLFLIPVVAVSASQIIDGFRQEKKHAVFIFLLLLVATVFGYFIGGNGFWFHYFPLLLLFSLYIIVKSNRFFKNGFVVVFCGIMLLMPLLWINYAQKIRYKEQKGIFQEFVLNRSDSCIVITNEVQKRLGEYYNEFRSNRSINFITYKDISLDSMGNKKKILFLNRYTRYLSGMDDGDLPYFARIPSEKNVLVYRNEELDIAIYEMNEILLPSQSFQEVLHSMNDFENPVPYWNHQESMLSTEVKYEGDKSNEVHEYSVTFQYPLDSVGASKFSTITISCRLYCYFEGRTTSKLVVSIENNEGAYIWQGHEINKFIKAYSNWWPVQHEIILNYRDIQPGSLLKVYVWNIDQDKAFIDNFEITLWGH